MWSLLSVRNIILQIFRHVQLVVLIAEGKTGSGSLIEEVRLMGGCENASDHSSILELYLCKFYNNNNVY